MNKRVFCIVAVAALLCAGAVGAFAYSKSDVIVQYLGSYTKYNFTKEYSSADTIAEDLGFMDMTKFYRITDEKLDKEDKAMLAFVEDNLNSYDLNNNDVYMNIVKRNQTASGYDGWIVLSYYAGADGFLHYIFYFAAQ